MGTCQTKPEPDGRNWFGELGGYVVGFNIDTQAEMVWAPDGRSFCGASRIAEEFNGLHAAYIGLLETADRWEERFAEELNRVRELGAVLEERSNAVEAQLRECERELRATQAALCAALRVRNGRIHGGMIDLQRELRVARMLCELADKGGA